MYITFLNNVRIIKEFTIYTHEHNHKQIIKHGIICIPLYMTMIL